MVGGYHGFPHFRLRRDAYQETVTHESVARRIDQSPVRDRRVLGLGYIPKTWDLLVGVHLLFFTFCSGSAFWVRFRAP